MLSKRNRKYWLNLGYSEKDALFESKKRTKGNYEYYKFFKNIKSEEEIQKIIILYKKEHAITLENMIKRHGEEVGTAKYENYVQLHRNKNTFEGKHKKYGWSREQFDTYNKSRSVTLENMIKRHGEEVGTAKFISYCERQSYTKTLPYFIEIYGEIDGNIQYKRVNKLKAHTYEAYLERCSGDEPLAKKLYQECKEKMSKNGGVIGSTSISADSFFDMVSLFLSKLGETDFRYSKKGGEQPVFCENKCYYVDFYFGKTKKIIEFYGDYWHCNPGIYLVDETVKFPDGKYVVEQIWNRDKIRIDNITKQGYEVLVVWEFDYNKNSVEQVKKCTEFLLS